MACRCSSLISSIISCCSAGVCVGVGMAFPIAEETRGLSLSDYDEEWRIDFTLVDVIPSIGT